MRTVADSEELYQDRVSQAVLRMEEERCTEQEEAEG